MKPSTPTLFAFLGWNTQGDLGPFTFYTTKRGKTVFFPKAPPTTPPSLFQTENRTRFQLVAQYWQRHSDTQKALWEFVTKKLRLNLTGYNLFVWYHTVGQRQTLATIERLAGVTLIED